MRAALGVVVVVLAIALGPTPADAWQRTLRPATDAIAGNERGDLVVLERRPHDGVEAVVAYDGVDGRIRWRWRVPPQTSCDNVVLDRVGNAVAGCRVYVEGQGVTAVGLDGATGAERWRRSPSGTLGADTYVGGDDRRPVAVDSAGDAFVLAWTTGPGLKATITKVDGVTGEELWRYRQFGGLRAILTVDAAGDAILSTRFSLGLMGEGRYLVTKLSGESGAVVWSTVTPAGVELDDIAVDAGSTVALAGSVQVSDDDRRHDFGVVALDGQSGTVRWTSRVADPAVPGGEALRAAIVDGDVVAAGFTRYGSGGDEGAFTVARLDGTTGAERWRRTMRGTAPPVYTVSDYARSLVVVPGGDLIVGGSLLNRRTCGDAVLLKLDGTSGEVEWMRTFDGPLVAPRCASLSDFDGLADVVPQMAGGVVADMDLVRRVEQNPGPGLDDTRIFHSDHRLLAMAEQLAGESLVAVVGRTDVVDVRSRDRRVLAPAPGDADAPRRVGATLQLVDPASGASATLPLPARGWQATRTQDGWRWDFAARGPCQRASVVAGRGLRVRCRGRGLGLPVAGTATSGLGVELHFGTGAQWCLAFDPTTASSGEGDRRFTAGPSAAPAHCR